MSPDELSGAKKKDPKISRVVTSLRARADEWLAEEAPGQFHDESTYGDLKKGDHVRILKTKLDDSEKNTIFKKHYVSGWSKGLYKIVSISRRKDTNRRAYGVQAQDAKEPLSKIFYRGDLQKVDADKLIYVQKKTQPTEGVFDRQLHMEKLHEQRKGATGPKNIHNARINCIFANTRSKRSLLKNLIYNIFVYE